MNDRDIPETTPQSSIEQQMEDAISAAPILDMDVFDGLVDVIRSHYLWKWEESAAATQEQTNELETRIRRDNRFRLVGDIEVEDDVFGLTLWMEESMVFTLASVDIIVLDALKIDFSRGALLTRDLTRMGLEYQIVTFGDGRAQQYCVNIIGPRMQQIRDLGTLVAPPIDSYSA